MGRLYIAQANSVAVTALQDVFEILCPSDSIIRIHQWTIFQTTDTGDAAEEILRLETTRGIGATSGSGGSSVTTQPLDDGDAATGATVEANNTTRMTAGGGSLETLEQYGWNVRIPLLNIYTPELRPVLGPSEFWTLALPVGPSDSLTVSAMVIYEEIGG